MANLIYVDEREIENLNNAICATGQMIDQTIKD
jgi:hypothetical protein